jgi:uncharacterized coiled-coil DUF342 family protein
MDSRIKELITQLQNKLIGYQKEIDAFQGRINSFGKQFLIDQATIAKQEKELKNLENKLFV